MTYEVTRHTEGAGVVAPRGTCGADPGGRSPSAGGRARGASSAVGRAVRSAAVVLLLLSPVALGGCSAGQVTQTATQARDRTGGAGQLEGISVHAVRLVHPPGGAYEVGDQVEVTMAIVNSGRVEDRLIDVTGAEFSDAAVGVSPVPAAPPPDTSAPAAGPVDATAPDVPPPAVATTAVDVVVPAGGAVFVGSGAPTVVLTGLTRRLDAARSVELTLTFAGAGRTTVLAMVEPTPRVLPRGPAVDFRAGPHDDDALSHAGVSGRSG